MDKTKDGQYRELRSFSIEEKHQMIQEYLKGGQTRAAVWKKYTGRPDEHGSIRRLMRHYGYDTTTAIPRIPVNFVCLNSLSDYSVKKRDTNFDQTALEKRIKDLERQLEDASIQAEGYRIMIELAEKEFKIPIRKKPNTK